MKAKWIVGVDEAGRGPLAGPVSVGAVKVSVNFDWGLIPGVNDSKKISEKKRDVIFEIANKLKNKGILDYSVKLVSATSIDRKGIVPAIKRAIEYSFKELNLNSEDCFVKLDGSLKAPEEFEQETIIKGDSKELVIGLASILAKVTRDKYMRKIAVDFPEYEFEKHKGYGTKAHREAIKKYGASTEHRNSYLGNIL